MKKFLFMLALMTASLGITNATANNAESLGDGTMAVSAVSVDGVYSGKATPSKMNGISVSSGKSYDCEYTIEGGYLSGDFTVGPHDVIMDSNETITGVGTFKVSGQITLGLLEFPFEGIINVESADGTNLVFSAYVTAKTLGNPVSEFRFEGKK